MILSSSGSDSGQVGGLGRAGWVRRGSAGSPGVCPHSQWHPGAAPGALGLSPPREHLVALVQHKWGLGGVSEEMGTAFLHRQKPEASVCKARRAISLCPHPSLDYPQPAPSQRGGICCATQDFLKQHIKFERFFFSFSRRAGTKIKEIHILWKYTGNCHHRWGTIYPDPPPPNCKHQNIYVFKQKKNIWLFNLS